MQRKENLRKLDGVVDVSVNLATEKARIVYEPSKIKIDRGRN
ncbi:MAG: cation transporter [Archaeoglobaceae archaeon]|nr:cation transporter [Archaeoglobaceae archaeon]